MLIRMKMKSLFYELPYWEHLKFYHSIYPMHILKNVSSSLWRHITLNKCDTLNVGRDLISSNTRKRHWPRKESIGDVSPSSDFKEGVVMWI